MSVILCFLLLCVIFQKE